MKVLSARRVPLRYRKEANKTIKELVERGVITPVNETLDWCSPAFFVPKGDKIRVRLVTDYTELNKHVIRPIHVFTHMTEILQANSSPRWTQSTDTSSEGWTKKVHVWLPSSYHKESSATYLSS